MEIQIHGRQIDLGDALKTHVEDKLIEGAEKYSHNPVDAQAFFSRDGHEFNCELTVHLSTGLRTNARGRGGDVYAAADSAIDKMEKQLRRYKRRLTNHHKSRNEPIESFPENAYVIEASNESDSVELSEDLQPAIVAETQVKVQNMAVGEAVMQMELSEESFLVFRNSNHGGVNVVFRREDGNIGWIDPRKT